MNGCGADRGDPTDLQLLERTGEGDERALELLYERYGHAVLAFVRRRTRDQGLAEEVAADVWLGCWRAASAFRGDSKVLTWLLGIAKRQVWSRARRREIQTVPLEEADASGSLNVDDPAMAVIAAEGELNLRAALAALPEDTSEVVRLAWLHNVPYQEIAETLEIPVGTVKSRISRARQTLRQTVRRQDAW